MTTVRSHLLTICTLSFQLQELLTDTYINDIPGENFLFSVTTDGIEICIDSAILESIEPLSVIEVFIPAIKPCASVYGIFDYRAKATVTASKNCLQVAT